MTVFVIRNGQVVEKDSIEAAVNDKRSILPSPMLSPRFETIESPVTEKPINSWRERDRDMAAAGAVDPRDLPRKPFEERRRKYGKPTDPEPGVSVEWRKPG